MIDLSSDFLLDLYGCAQHPDRWRGVLDQLSDSMSARSAIVQVFDRDDFRLHQRWCARDSFSTTHARHHDALVNNDSNPRTDLRFAAPIGRDPILRDNEMFAPGCGQLAALRTRLSSLGLGQAIGVGVVLDSGSSLALMLHRAQGDDRAFSIEEENFLRALAPHLEQMARGGMVAQTLIAERDESRAAIDQFGGGVILCDAHRQIVWCNDAAARLLDRSRHLDARNGTLRCGNAEDERWLVDRIAAILDRRGSAPDRLALVLGRGQPDPLHALICTTATPDLPTHALGSDRRHALLLLSEPAQRVHYSAHEIADLFDLSPAEAMLAGALASGISLHDFAAARGISVGTARIQLKHVLAKTGTHRQAELVAQIAGSVLGLSRLLLH